MTTPTYVWACPKPDCPEKVLATGRPKEYTTPRWYKTHMWAKHGERVTAMPPKVKSWEAKRSEMRAERLARSMTNSRVYSTADMINNYEASLHLFLSGRGEDPDPDAPEFTTRPGDGEWRTIGSGSPSSSTPSLGDTLAAGAYTTTAPPGGPDLTATLPPAPAPAPTSSATTPVFRRTAPIPPGGAAAARKRAILHAIALSGDDELADILKSMATTTVSGTTPTTGAKPVAKSKAEVEKIKRAEALVKLTEIEKKEKKVDGESVPEDKACKVCLDSLAIIATVPCGHRSTCAACAKSIITGNRKCPICREVISDVLRVFDS